MSLEPLICSSLVKSTGNQNLQLASEVGVRGHFVILTLNLWDLTLSDCIRIDTITSTWRCTGWDYGLTLPRSGYNLWKQKSHKSCSEDKGILMKVKGSEKAGLNLNIPNTKIRSSNHITSWQIKVGGVEAVTNFIILGS